MANTADIIYTEPETTKKTKRIWELDFLRGFSILLMVVDHLLITVAFFYGPEWFKLSGGAGNLSKFYEAAVFYYYHPARDIIHLFVIFLFISLCGLSTGFSRNNLKRGCVLGLVSLAITAFTHAIKDESVFVYFGILHNLTFDIILWSILSAATRHNKKANTIIGLMLAFVVFGLFFATQTDAALKEKIGGSFFIFIQTESTFDMSRGDFFPLIPWSGIFFLGAALSPCIFPDKKSHLEKLDGKWNKPVCFIGRHTLIVYVIHVFAIVAVLELISYFKYDIWLLTEYL